MDRFRIIPSQKKNKKQALHPDPATPALLRLFRTASERESSFLCVFSFYRAGCFMTFFHIVLPS